MEVFDEKFLDKYEIELAGFIKENIYAPFRLTNEDVKLDLIIKDLRSRAKISDPEICKMRRDYFSVVSDRVEDFQEKIHWDKNVLKITGLRFKNLDLSNDYSLHKSPPFIEVMTNRAAQSEDLIASVKTVRELKTGPMGEDVDLQLHASLVENMALCSDSQLSLEVFKDKNIAIESYHRYYQEFSGSSPKLSIQVPKRDDDEISEIFDEGHLFCLLKKGIAVGLIGLSPAPFMGQEAFRVIVEHIGSDFRGQGLATQMQAKLKDILSPSTILWGEIEPTNLSSVKTAKRSKRPRLGHYEFRELP